MNRIDIYATLQFILIFVFSFLLLNLLREKKPSRRIKRKNIYASFDFKTLATMLIAVVAITFLLTRFSRSTLTSGVVFIVLLLIAPYMYINNQNRKHQEEILNDIILYCQNISLVIKQTNNVFHALKVVVEDLNTEFKNDVLILMDNFQYDEKIIKETMEEIERKYPYTCLMQLHIIMLYMNFETDKMPSALIDTFQDDVALLDADIRNNKGIRKAMRIQYFGITIGSILIYYAFCNQLSGMMQATFDSPTFKIINTIYLLLNIISLFWIDRYFNSHISME